MPEIKKIYWMGFKSRSDTADEKISELENTEIESTQSETKEEKGQKQTKTKKQKTALSISEQLQSAKYVCY